MNCSALQKMRKIAKNRDLVRKTMCENLDLVQKTIYKNLDLVRIDVWESSYEKKNP